MPDIWPVLHLNHASIVGGGLALQERSHRHRIRTFQPSSHYSDPVIQISKMPAADREILDRLEQWSPVAPAQVRLSGEYRAFVRERQAAALERDGGPEHLTGSCFVLTPDLSQVLLCFHRKGQFWVQLGGHVESHDKTVAAAAYREAHEESGLTDIRPFDTTPVDLHRHLLPSSFGTCRVHWDVGFVGFADVDTVPVVSAESQALAWFGVDRLPPQAPEDLALRLRTVLGEVAHRQV
jgi:8-oxo-dGTP pyrophosphatase MutT (NUDIX family)